MTELPLEIRVPIFTYGALYTDQDFDCVYPPSVLTGLSEQAIKVARSVAPGISENDIWASGFSDGYSSEDLQVTDALKLGRGPSTMHKQLAEEQVDGFEGNLPIYYATPMSGILHRTPKDNPLSYIRNIPGVGYLALYDGKAISTDLNLCVTAKTDRHIHIAGLGAHIVRHTLAVLRLEYIDE